MWYHLVGESIVKLNEGRIINSILGNGVRHPMSGSGIWFCPLENWDGGVQARTAGTKRKCEKPVVQNKKRCLGMKRNRRVHCVCVCTLMHVHLRG